MKKINLLTMMLLFFVTGLIKAQTPIVVEAETGTFTGNLSIATLPAGFTGTGYVTGFANAAPNAEIETITLNSSIATEGLYKINVRYYPSDSDKETTLKVNNEVATLKLIATDSFSTAAGGNFFLPAGEVTFVIEEGWGYFGIDNVTIAPAVIEAPKKPADKVLVNDNASCEAKALYSYLYDTYGTKSLLGQQVFDNMDDINYVFEQTGKFPAIGGFDFIKYSPSRRQGPATPEDPTGLSELFIDWNKKNDGKGIVALMWHWNAPIGLDYTKSEYAVHGDSVWFAGYTKIGTTMDIEEVLSDTASEAYKLILRDMDTIAYELKKFQKEGIPVLWRPLHEASDWWFWWAEKGPETYKKLWQLMYTRYTHHHKLNNLIWVFTGPGAQGEWYPGDDYVDIVGVDIYLRNGTYDANFSSQWSSLQKMFGERKLIALTEVESIPSAEKATQFQTWWSWITVWNDFAGSTPQYIRAIPVAHLNAVYNSEEYITLDELPTWNVVSDDCVTSIAKRDNVHIMELFPNPANEMINIVADGKDVTVMNHLGQLVSVQKMNGPVNQFSLQGLVEGVYFVKVTTLDNQVTVKSFVKK